MNFFFSLFRKPLCAVPCVVLAACSSSSSSDGPVDSGRDVSHQDVMTAPVDTGVDAGVDATTPMPDACVLPDAAIAVEAGSQTWSSLYRDYFGPGGAASCAGNGNCHGSASEPGYTGSGFLCPTGDASTGCWQGINSQNADGGVGIINPGGTYADDPIGQILCQECDTGEMPKGCSYVFTPYDIARISDWINAGAQNN